MNRKISVGVGVALVLIAATITFTATMIFSMRLYDAKILNVKEREAMYNKLSEVDGVVRQNLYFDIDENALYDTIAEGYIDGIGDPDSSYLSQQEIADRIRQAEGTEVTVGFETVRDAAGYIAISKIHPGTAAEQLGLLEKDTIVRVNGEDVLAIGYDAAAAMLRGAAGSKVTITYARDGEETDEELTREIIETVSVVSAKLNHLYYIRIRAFQTPTPEQFLRAVNAALTDTECRGFIIDLRGTDGGHAPDIAAAMLDRLMPTGTIISGLFGDGSTKVLYTSDDESVTLPVAVVVDQDTKGFAELFAGVLGDTENCQIVGWTTFGKGTLQSLTMLSDGSGLDLTVAVLQLPVSGSFNEVGIRPDYEVEVPEEFTFVDTRPDMAADPQLQKAVEAVESMIR